MSVKKSIRPKAARNVACLMVRFRLVRFVLMGFKEPEHLTEHWTAPLKCKKTESCDARTIVTTKTVSTVISGFCSAWQRKAHNPNQSKPKTKKQNRRKCAWLLLLHELQSMESVHRPLLLLWSSQSEKMHTSLSKTHTHTVKIKHNRNEITSWDFRWR